jgi:aminoglycoside phosphotransferase family enzyme
MQLFMPYLDKARAETIFVDGLLKNEDDHITTVVLHGDHSDKIRKRVLISSDYRSAFKVRHMCDLYMELN